MREYRFQASDETVALLRLLRGPWSGFRVTDRVFAVTLLDGTVVSLRVGAADIEDAFEAFRIEAGSEPLELALRGVPMESAGDFANGGNDVVLFTGATWSESASPSASTSASGLPSSLNGSAMALSGHPGQLSETAEVVCLTTDAVVLAAPSGRGMLVRTGVAPYSVDTIYDRDEIARFLRERGYADA